ncbi:hypothetical protein J6V85_03270, partial [Candidatus Saccharibacteria bacterium]|nr:hypothetical protein [Candidatus Saccharibacteria bacterium]
MQTVSDKWKQNQERDFTSEGYLDITMQVTDPEVFRVGSVAVNTEADISMTNTVLGMDSYDVKPYTTLEPYVWKLDGTRIGLPDTGELFTGYVSEVTCNGAGNFTTQPVITISFSETITHTVPGITLIFSEVYDSYATSFLLEVSNNGNVIYSLDETANDKATVIIDQDFVNFDEVSLTIRKWLKPYERARVAALLMGFTEQFTKTDIFKYQNTQYIGLVSDKLPKLEITFDVDNTSGKFNPLNPDGITAYLMNKQEISVKYGFKLNNNVEYITGGTYFLSEWSAPQNGLKATFRARDILEYFNNTYMKGRYVPAGQTLYDMAMDIFTEANLPLNRDGTVRYHVDNSLQTIKTKAPLPLQSMAVCLQLIANAGKCIIRPTRDGQIYIEPLNIDLSDYEINNFNSYKKAEIETIKQVKDIKVK